MALYTGLTGGLVPLETVAAVLDVHCAVAFDVLSSRLQVSDLWRSLCENRESTGCLFAFVAATKLVCLGTDIVCIIQLY